MLYQIAGVNAAAMYTEWDYYVSTIGHHQFFSYKESEVSYFMHFNFDCLFCKMHIWQKM